MNLDAILTRAVLRSRAFGAADRARRLFVTAARGSAVRRLLQRVRAPRAGQPPLSVQRWGGMVVLAMVLTHVVLLLTLGEYRGWPSLILPSTGGVLAVLAILSAPERRTHP